MVGPQSLVGLRAINERTGLLQVIVETPKGSRNKYKYEEPLGIIGLNKVLPLGSSFPFDFGFIPSTRGEDGDPLDVLLLMDEPAFPGCLVPARLIGVLEAKQTEKGETVRNDRLLALVETPYNRPEIDSVEQLSKTQLEEIEQFFISYNRIEGREFVPIGRHGPERARKLLEEGRKRFTGSKRG